MNKRYRSKRIIFILAFVILVLSLIVVFANASELKNDTSIVCIDLADFFYEIILALTIFPPQAFCTDAEQADIAAFIQNRVNAELDSLPGTIKTRNKVCSDPINSRRLNLLTDDVFFDPKATTDIARVETSFFRSVHHAPEKQEQQEEKIGSRHLLRHGRRPFIFVGGGRCRFCFYDNSDKRVLVPADEEPKWNNKPRDLMYVIPSKPLATLPKVADIALCTVDGLVVEIYTTQFHPHRHTRTPSSSRHRRTLDMNKSINHQYPLNLEHDKLSPDAKHHRNLMIHGDLGQYLKNKFANTNHLSRHEKDLLLHDAIRDVRSHFARKHNRTNYKSANDKHVKLNNAKHTNYIDKMNGKKHSLLGLYGADDRFSILMAVNDATDISKRSNTTQKLPVKEGKLHFSLSAFDLPTEFSKGLLDDNPLYIFINGIKLDFNLLLSQPGVVVKKNTASFLQAQGGSIAGITWSISVRRNGDFGYGSRPDRLYVFIIRAPLLVFAHKNQLDIDFIIKPSAKAKHYGLNEFGVWVTGAGCEVTDLENSRFDDFKSAVESRIHNRLGLDLAHKYQNKLGHCLYDRIPVVNAHLVQKETWQGTNPKCKSS